MQYFCFESTRLKRSIVILFNDMRAFKLGQIKFPIRNFGLIILLSVSAGCTTLPRRAAPVDKMYDANISGMPGIRAWSDTISKQLEADLLLSVRQEMKQIAASESGGMSVINTLSLSGGGDNGAFGAGFMQGWSKTGTRPVFKIVTGISTGALIATFAFLGSEYDNTLKQAYTTTSAKNIYIPRWLGFLWNDSFTDTAPFKRLIKHYISKDVFQKVSQAHQRGRRLYIGTTNLDADRLVIWNMGAIASSGDPKALHLFRQVILASASIPVAFPPVLIEVEIDGVSYDEMHVDGGVKAQLFLLAATLDFADFRKKTALFADIYKKRNIFVIRNAEVDPEPKQISRNITRITERALSSLLKTQALNDLNRIYLLANKEGLDFNWVALPDEYEPAESDEFDRKEMNRLFKKGYEEGLKENVWKKVPPGISQP